MSLNHDDRRMHDGIRLNLLHATVVFMTLALPEQIAHLDHDVYGTALIRMSGFTTMWRSSPIAG